MTTRRTLTLALLVFLACLGVISLTIGLSLWITEAAIIALPLVISGAILVTSVLLYSRRLGGR